MPTLVDSGIRCASRNPTAVGQGFRAGEEFEQELMGLTHLEISYVRREVSDLPISRSRLRQSPILVVEDDSNARLMLCFALRRKGYFVEEASDGASALSKSQQCRPALILTDFQMPGMNGMELMESVRSLEGFRDVP